MLEKRYKCPCCGYHTYTIPVKQAHGSICPVCYWENDTCISSDSEPSDSNHGITLAEAIQNFKKIGACEKGMLPYVRPPQGGEIEVKD
ncbi:MAG: hypothetical protein IJZ13_01820 [Clostridia bacterium]|nr:hypothetical protein [Clostridia bacterium]